MDAIVGYGVDKKILEEKFGLKDIERVKEAKQDEVNFDLLVDAYNWD